MKEYLVKSQLNILHLVYPPISNQEAEWIKNDKDVQRQISRSNLYMIAQREEAKFLLRSEDEVVKSVENKVIPFSFATRSHTDEGYFDLEVLQQLHAPLSIGEIEMEAGEKFFRFWRVDGNQKRVDLLDWFTTEKLLFDKWQGSGLVGGIERFRDFSKYRLHYVGISKKDDSLIRLVEKPHDKRIRVLTNEHPLNPGSRVSDEVVFLFFEVNPLRINIAMDEDDIEEIVQGYSPNKIQLVADAEKAFVNMLESKYNDVRFNEYPKGGDGLYDTGLIRYGYVIGEGLTLTTDSIEFRGSYIGENVFPNDLDSIFIEGDRVTIERPPAESA